MSGLYIFVTNLLQVVASHFGSIAHGLPRSPLTRQDPSAKFLHKAPPEFSIPSLGVVKRIINICLLGNACLAFCGK